MMTNILALQSAYRRLYVGGGYPPSAWKISTRLIDCSFFKASINFQNVGCHAGGLREAFVRYRPM